MADLLSLVIRGKEEKTMISILNVRVSGLESTLSCNNTRIGELGSQMTSRISESDVATEEKESTEGRPHFCKDSASLSLEQVQSQGPQLGEGEAA